MNKIIKTIPADLKFKGAPPLDENFNIELEQQFLELIEGDRSVPLNLAERFNDERQNISLYRIYGKLQTYMDNAYSGNADPSISNLFYNLYSTGEFGVGFPEYKEFDFIRTDVDESVGDETNWNLYITIPATCNAVQPMVYQPEEGGSSLNFIASDGIPFNVKNVTVGGKQLIEINCGAPHGVKVGEYVKLNFHTAYTFTPAGDTFPIYSIGNGTYKSEERIFSLFIPKVNLMSPIPQGALGTFKRQLVLNDVTSISSYYVIEHEILTLVKDYNLNKCAFAKGVFKKIEKFQPAIQNPDGIEREAVKVEYPTYLYTFIKDIDVKKYLDNLKRPITALYVTIMLRNNLGYFNYPPHYGWGWNFPYSFADLNIDNGNFIVRGHPGDQQPVSGIIFFQPTPNIASGRALQVGDRLRGAFTEYNVHELKERTISEIKHKFDFNPNVFAGSEGYVYKPHYRVPIRSYSDYIESGDPDIVANIPNYATYFTDEKIWKWRDIYDIGFIAGSIGVDYPFLNNAHYPMTDIDFFVHRTIRADAFNMTISVSAATNTLENLIIDGCE